MIYTRNKMVSDGRLSDRSARIPSTPRDLAKRWLQLSDADRAALLAGEDGKQFARINEDAATYARWAKERIT